MLVWDLGDGRWKGRDRDYSKFRLNASLSLAPPSCPHSDPNRSCHDPRGDRGGSIALRLSSNLAGGGNPPISMRVTPTSAPNRSEHIFRKRRLTDSRAHKNYRIQVDVNGFNDLDVGNQVGRKVNPLGGDRSFVGLLILAEAICDEALATVGKLFVYIQDPVCNMVWFAYL